MGSGETKCRFEFLLQNHIEIQDFSGEVYLDENLGFTFEILSGDQ